MVVLVPEPTESESEDPAAVRDPVFVIVRISDASYAVAVPWTGVDATAIHDCC